MYSTPETIDVTSTGAPLLSKGLVVGMLTTVGDDDAPQGVRWVAIRPEMVAALKPHELIPWKAWPARVKAVLRAEQLATRAAGKNHDGRHEAALEDARASVLSDELCWAGWLSLAQAHHATGHDAESLSAAGSALELAPTLTGAYVVRGHVLAHIGHSAEAIAAARQAVKLDAEDVDAHATLGYSLQYAGRLEEAAEEYRRAMKIEPADWVREELEAVEKELHIRSAASSPPSDSHSPLATPPSPPAPPAPSPTTPPR
jgi:tetratricopeptide (TPR) repeat protein